jgi:hypothetical protein
MMRRSSLLASIREILAAQDGPTRSLIIVRALNTRWLVTL